jgi:hypothetical protein
MKHALVFVLAFVVPVLGGCATWSQSVPRASETAATNRALSVSVELETGRVRLLEGLALQGNEMDGKR